MNNGERLALSQAAVDAYVQKARDYGELRKVGVNLGSQQLDELKALEWPSISEHIRRAVDIYLSIGVEHAPSDDLR